jgi:hypothetical protein
MGSKNQPGDFDCYGNALPDEPMFILLARDPSAPALIEWWADNRESAIDQKLRPEGDRAMVAEARQCAKAMRDWRSANDGIWRLPPSRRRCESNIVDVDGSCLECNAAQGEACQHPEVAQ